MWWSDKGNYDSTEALLLVSTLALGLTTTAATAGGEGDDNNNRCVPLLHGECDERSVQRARAKMAGGSGHGGIWTADQTAALDTAR